MPTTERQLGRIWAAESRAFAAAFPHTAAVRLALTSRHHLPAAERTPRDLAWYMPAERTIYLFTAALQRSPGHIRGLLRHELGHAADKRLDAPGCERRADRLAARATGAPIRYTAEGLQHATHGTPRRPDWLHQ